MQKVMAIDPGITTGIAIVDLTGSIVGSCLNTSVIDVMGSIVSTKPDLVIIEDFVGAGPRSKESIFVLKLIGMVLGVCFIEKIPYVVQVPQIRVPYVSVAKEMGEGRSRHIIDAYAHALAWLAKPGAKDDLS